MIDGMKHPGDKGFSRGEMLPGSDDLFNRFVFVYIGVYAGVPHFFDDERIVLTRIDHDQRLAKALLQLRYRLLPAGGEAIAKISDDDEVELLAGPGVCRKGGEVVVGMLHANAPLDRSEQFSEAGGDEGYFIDDQYLVRG